MEAVKISGDVATHPKYTDWLQGWGVMAATKEKWHLASVHADLEEAEAEAHSLGEPYGVQWGAHRPGSDEFVYEPEPKKSGS
ncbi:hypothetical protein V0R52_01200 [Pseudomonas asiatica]|uniref:hypothetical protein n=1 Tax=Pseudomonas asiatica TaxID=2219225 RepID=UPI002E7B7EDC|nr:hypothetical protein [Pseudomonas asiatica]MEE1915000.1 hypothetical protein [Pseudomonas asiatica]